MKIIDDIVKKFGVDKILHFLGGGWITSAFSPIGWWGILIGFIVMFVLSVLKEKFLDTFFDWTDIIAATCGSATAAVIYLILSWII